MLFVDNIGLVILFYFVLIGLSVLGLKLLMNLARWLKTNRNNRHNEETYKQQ